MAEKRPLCLYGGNVKELQPGDAITGVAYIDASVNFEEGLNISPLNNYNVWINIDGEDPGHPTVEFGFGDENDRGLVYVITKAINTDSTCTLNFNNQLNGADPNIVLTTADVGFTGIFKFDGQWWYTIYRSR